MDKLDARVDKLLQKISKEVNHDHMVDEEYLYESKIHNANTSSLEHQIYELKQQVQTLTEMVSGLQGATVIEEGKSDEVHLVIMGHHFKGKMSPVKK